ncbi:PREDICTED: uncharacterized protein LOC104820601 [Tarenaya hassleriana]|uniref:uncharacterized protein LOC104820601 n=1 Tax=Tarenaya hassleriana TaxID=28532 RepID=UPI00053C346F|nr:PREDICTED: uncharacterized protein LOC104820601 [Tarenaya hassleriana]
MAERKLNFNAPLLSTRRSQTTAVSVRRTKKLSDEDFKRSEGSSKVAVCYPDMALDPITDPASVPFTWEQEPGRLKGDSLRPETHDSMQDFVPPRNPPGKVMDLLKSPWGKDSDGENAVRTALDDNVTRLQILKGKQVQESDDDDDDDAFSDALDTLSPKESCSAGVNHSISGVSGYGIEMKKPPILAEDPQTRDFMLNRFLPAAKAMTVEQPQYASKRQLSPVMSEPTRQIRDIVPARQIREIVSAEKCRTPNRYESIIPPYYHEQVEDAEESEDEEDEVSEFANSAYMSKRGCGFLPQLCFRNSLGMLKTVPGLKPKPDSLVTSSHRQVKASKVSQLKSQFQTVKIALDSVYKQKSSDRAQSPMHPSVAKKFNRESEQLGQNLATASRSSSPYRHAGCMSPYRSTANSSPLHPMGFPGTRKEAENLRANRLNKHIKSISRSQELIYPKSARHGCSTISVPEKTMYIDTGNSPIASNRQNLDIKMLPEPELVETVSEEVDKTSGKKSDTNLELDAISSGEIVKVDGLGKIERGGEPSPLAPPLPKKPSESWLMRNLPSVSSQISSRRSPFRPQRMNPEEKSSSVSKWETIVKTSYVHSDHIRYSEELVAHTRRKSKT